MVVSAVGISWRIRYYEGLIRGYFRSFILIQVIDVDRNRETDNAIEVPSIL